MHIWLLIEVVCRKADPHSGDGGTSDRVPLTHRGLGLPSPSFIATVDLHSSSVCPHHGPQCQLRNRGEAGFVDSGYRNEHLLAGQVECVG